MSKEKKVTEILKRLKKMYANPVTALSFSNPLELLVATILSAQTTDKLVNTLTPALFTQYRTARDYANAPLAKLQSYVKKVNFFGNKSKNIQASARIIDEKYGGEVPQTMEELDALPGVARKTEYVVLWNGFGKNEGVCVDTHFIRLTKNLG
ncbi:MAG: endonuclease III, partial [Patescibacteria group bacterium]